MNRAYIIMACLTAFIIFGCEKANNDITPVNEQQEEETINVSLGLGGEITVSESPLSRAAGSETSSNDLYGINVYYDKDSDGKIDDHYAYGLFDNVNDMVITLVTGHKYKFECRMVVDGKAACYPGTSSNAYYGYPFHPYSSISGETYSQYQRCSNRFISGTNFFDRYFKLGETCKSGYVADTYYGEVTEYTPKAGGIVNIEMKRCSYGLKINVSGLTKGQMSLDINSSSGKDDDLGVYVYTISGFKGTYSASSDGDIFSNVLSFYSTYDCWVNAVTSDDYSGTIPLRVYWSYTYDGTSVKESFEKYQAVTLKRNVMTTININLNIDTKGQEENSFNLTRSEKTMSSQTYTYNYNISLNGTVDNPINPS